MILTRNSDGTYTLPDGTSIDEATYQAQLTPEEKASLNPNPNPNPPNESSRGVETLQNLILQEEVQRLRSLLDKVGPSNTPAPTPEPTLNEGEFFNNPNKALGVINQMLERQVGPLKDFMAQFKRDQAYGALKNQVRARFPQFTQIEPLVDQYMQGQEPNEQNLTRAVQQAVGAAALRDPSFLNSSANPATNQPINPTNPTPTPPTVITPPHLSPSPARQTPKNDSNQPDMSQFDENAKRLMRENGMGPREFILLRDTPSDKLMGAAFQKQLEDARKADRGA